MTAPLQTKDLSRSYGKFQALMPTDLTLHSGEITVLLGPNGAGKSTLLLCLSGLLRPSTGTVTIDGHDLYTEEKEAKRQLAFVPDVPRFYTELTAWEHLYFIAQAHQAGNDFDQKAENCCASSDCGRRATSIHITIRVGCVSNWACFSR